MAIRPPEGESTRAWSGSLVKLRQFLFDRIRLQREESILDHDLLPFFAVDKLDELFDDRIERLIGRLVHIEIEMPPERIGPIVGVLLGRLLNGMPSFSARGTARTFEVR